MSSPSNSTSPVVVAPRGKARMIVRAVIDLPLPGLADEADDLTAVDRAVDVDDAGPVCPARFEAAS